MKNKTFAVLATVAVVMQSGCVVSAESVASAGGVPSEASANSSAFPKQILRTGINLNSSGVSVNSVQLANDIKLSPILERMQATRKQIDSMGPSTEQLAARVELLELKEKASQIVYRTNLEIDFVMAEMMAEQNVYNEILSTFTGDRDKLLARVNAASFISNGILWALAEGFDIPTHTHAFYANPSGITGILAGVIPSFASMYTLKAVSGKKKTSEIEPNMLAKLFKYPTTSDIDYPNSVWLYLSEVPATDPKGKTRIEQMVDRWISDSNIPGFTNRNSTSQLDVITASVAQKKGLTIGSLNTRQVMLQQLSAEVMKMKRMLLELAMVVQGDKQFVTNQPGLAPTPSAKLLKEKSPIAEGKNGMSLTEACASLDPQRE